MFSYENRLRAVQLYIKLGKRIGLTIRQLGYIRWYNEARIKISLGARSPIEHRRSLGIAV